MKVLELFAGTRSIGKAFEARGHQVFSIDWGDFDRIDLRADISTLSADAKSNGRSSRPCCVSTLSIYAKKLLTPRRKKDKRRGVKKMYA